MRVFTWHVHGSYLFYLASAPHTFYVPVRPGRPEGYGGRCGPFPWPANVVEVPAEAVRDLAFDCVLYQTRRNLERDGAEILSPVQRRLPAIYLEHDPPRRDPVRERHWVDDPDVLLVHVTPFNALMWDCGRTPTRVIEHGVTVPAEVRWTGEVPRGLVVVNGLRRRGRLAGADVFEAVRARLPLDLVGMQSEELGGLGEVPHPRLPAFEARYRLFVNPIRYTSLPLALCEAMMLGMPVAALATTEVAAVIEHGVSGLADTSLPRLVDGMGALLRDRAAAAALGREAARRARERFAIGRFVADWNAAFADVTGGRLRPTRVAAGTV